MSVDNGPVDNSDQAIADFFRLLTAARDDAVSSGNYLEAEVAHKRLLELKRHEEKRRKEAIRSKHNEEIMNLEEAHLEEHDGLNQKWRKLIEDHDEEAREAIRNMKERHAIDKTEWEQDLQQQPFLRPKYTVELRNMRRIEQTLARQKKFQEAYRMKKKADKIEQEELASQKEVCRFKVLHLRSLFKKRQTSELLTAKERFELSRNKLIRSRQKEEREMQQRYIAAKRDMTFQHAKEKKAQSKQELMLAPVPVMTVQATMDTSKPPASSKKSKKKPERKSPKKPALSPYGEEPVSARAKPSKPNKTPRQRREAAQARKAREDKRKQERKEAKEEAAKLDAKTKSRKERHGKRTAKAYSSSR